VVVLLNGREAYVEIKRKASEDKQSVPKLLEEGLVRLQHELPYNLSVKMQDRDYDCSDLEARFCAVRQHVETWERLKAQEEWLGEQKPPSIGGPFIIFFHERRSDGPWEGVPEHFDPDYVKDLKRFLLVPGVGRDGKRMVPMVEQAIEKGADYLLCRVSCWDGWEELVEECFGHVTWTTPRTCFAPEGGLKGLRGVVLFSRYDDFCVVNNPSCEDEAWLVG
jgi:hypothetical protein